MSENNTNTEKQVSFALSPDIPKQIWKAVFTSDSPEFADFYFDTVYRNEYTLLLTLSGQPAAHLQMLPCEMVYCGQTIKANYLSGVSTLPQFRGKGCMDALMRRAFYELYQNGTVISTLIPAKPDIYLKYGYRFTYFLDKSTVSNTRCFTHLYETTSLTTLDSIYQSCFGQYNMRVVRTPKHWETILYEHRYFEKGRLFVTDGAYALVSFYPKTPLIKELGYLNETARQKMLHALTGSFGTLELLLPGGKTPFAQSRVISVQAVLDILRQRNSFTPFTLQVTDPYIEQNNRCYRITPEQISVCESADIKLDIAEFTRCISGDAEIASKLDAKCRKFFPENNNYMNLMLN